MEREYVWITKHVTNVAQVIAISGQLKMRSVHTGNVQNVELEDVQIVFIWNHAISIAFLQLECLMLLGMQCIYVKENVWSRIIWIIIISVYLRMHSYSISKIKVCTDSVDCFVYKTVKFKHFMFAKLLQRRKSKVKYQNNTEEKTMEEEMDMKSFINTDPAPCYIDFEFRIAYHQPLYSKDLFTECIAAGMNETFLQTAKLKIDGDEQLSTSANDISIIQIDLIPNESNPIRIEVSGYLTCKDEDKQKYLDALQMAAFDLRKISKQLSDRTNIKSSKLRLSQFVTKISDSHHVNKSYIDKDKQVKLVDALNIKIPKYGSSLVHNDMIGNDSDDSDANSNNGEDIEVQPEKQMEQKDDAVSVSDDNEYRDEGAGKQVQHAETLMGLTSEDSVDTEYEMQLMRQGMIHAEYQQQGFVNNKVQYAHHDEKEDELEGQMVGAAMTLLGGTNDGDDKYADFRSWLRGLGLEKYLENFVVNGFGSMDAIMSYDEMNETNNLKDIVDDKGDYNKLLKIIKRRQRKESESSYDPDPEKLVIEKGKGITMMGLAKNENEDQDAKESMDDELVGVNAKGVTLMGAVTNGNDIKDNDETELIKGVSLMAQTEKGDAMGKTANNDNEADDDNKDDLLIQNGGFTLMGVCDESENFNE